jgi:hypothetical protein
MVFLERLVAPSRRLFRATIPAILFTCLLSALSGLAMAADEAAAPAAAVQLPPWMSPELVKAAVDINMTDAQKPEFNKVVGDYVTEHFQMIQKEVKRGAPNLDMTIKSKDNALAHAMDKQVKTVLTKQQWPAYQKYKKVLRDGLKHMN